MDVLSCLGLGPVSSAKNSSPRSWTSANSQITVRSYNFHLSLVGAVICGPAMAVSKNSYVWAAPMKRQTSTVPVQDAASAPTYAWGRQPAPIMVFRSTTRVMARPLPPAPVVVARRTIRVVVKPAQVVVRAAAPPQLPHLLGSPKAPATSCPSCPVKGLPQAGVGEPKANVTALHDVTASDMTEKGRREAVLEASAPAPELVYPKGRPVSYGPARPFLQIEEDCPQAGFSACGQSSSICRNGLAHTRQADPSGRPARERGQKLLR